MPLASRGRRIFWLFPNHAFLWSSRGIERCGSGNRFPRPSPDGSPTPGEPAPPTKLSMRNCIASLNCLLQNCCGCLKCLFQKLPWQSEMPLPKLPRRSDIQLEMLFKNRRGGVEECLFPKCLGGLNYNLKCKCEMQLWNASFTGNMH